MWGVDFPRVVAISHSGGPFCSPHHMCACMITDGDEAGWYLVNFPVVKKHRTNCLNTQPTTLNPRKFLLNPPCHKPSINSCTPSVLWKGKCYSSAFRSNPVVIHTQREHHRFIIISFPFFSSRSSFSFPPPLPIDRCPGEIEHPPIGTSGGPRPDQTNWCCSRAHRKRSGKNKRVSDCSTELGTSPGCFMGIKKNRNNGVIHQTGAGSVLPEIALAPKGIKVRARILGKKMIILPKA